MKITIERNPKNVQLLKLMADKNLSKAIEAREAFAAFVAPAIQTVIEQAPVISNLYRKFTYDWTTPPFINLDYLFDIKQKNFIRVWAQQEAGGLATNAPSPISKLPVMTYELVSAVSFQLDQLRAANLDIVALGLERMAQEVLVKQEVNSVNPLMAAAAQAQYLTNTNNSAYQVYRASTQGQVVPTDFYKLMTLMSRVNASWVGGTPMSNVRSITHFVGSPEFLEQVRIMAFEPLQTRLATTYPMAGPEKFRDEIYQNAGTPTFAGVEIVNVYEMGKGNNYNSVFANYAGSNAYAGYGGSGTATFSQSAEQVTLGIDARQNFLVQLAEADADTGATFTVALDDQFVRRSEKIGYYGKLREGRVVLDARNLTSLIW